MDFFLCDIHGMFFQYCPRHILCICHCPEPDAGNIRLLFICQQFTNFRRPAETNGKNPGGVGVQRTCMANFLLMQNPTEFSDYIMGCISFFLMYVYNSIHSQSHSFSQLFGNMLGYIINDVKGRAFYLAPRCMDMASASKKRSDFAHIHNFI